MEKKDIIVILVALLIVFLMAVVVKPLITGEPVVFLPELPRSEQQTEPFSTPDYPYQVTPTSYEVILTPEPTPVPEASKPVSTEGPRDVITPVPTPMTWQPDPDNPMPAIQMTNYAEIIGRYTGSTSMFRIPTPYWELHYNVTPIDSDAAFSMDVREVFDGEEKTIRTITWRDGKISDPRELRFFEGGKEYYIQISAHQLSMYRITIQIPLKYIRDT